jgi:hypothetical protein
VNDPTSLSSSNDANHLIGNFSSNTPASPLAEHQVLFLQCLSLLMTHFRDKLPPSIIAIFITQQASFLKKAYQPPIPIPTASESDDEESQGSTKEEHQVNKDNNEQPIVTPAPSAEEPPVTTPIKEQQPSNSPSEEEPDNNEDDEDELERLVCFVESESNGKEDDATTDSVNTSAPSKQKKKKKNKKKKKSKVTIKPRPKTQDDDCQEDDVSVTSTATNDSNLSATAPEYIPSASTLKMWKNNLAMKQQYPDYVINYYDDADYFNYLEYEAKHYAKAKHYITPHPPDRA